MGTRRAEKPYIWVTWISKLLGGDLECQWAAWFKAHYHYEKFEEMGGDLAKWNADHTRLMEQKKAQLEKLGYVVTTEKQNEFKLEGETAIVAGKPDLVGEHPGNTDVPPHTIIVDGKTGQQKNGDWWQVFIYLFAWPKDRARRRVPVVGELSGELYYAKGANREQVIEYGELTPIKIETLVAMIKTIGGATAPEKRPSREECKRCNIGPADCPERVMGKPRETTKVQEW